MTPDKKFEVFITSLLQTNGFPKKNRVTFYVDSFFSLLGIVNNVVFTVFVFYAI